jgi:integrase
MPRISRALLATLQPGQEVFDSRTEGFGVRRFETRASYIFRYSINGKRKRVTLGRADAMTVDEARAKAIQAAAAVAKGEDPFAKTERGHTVEDLANAWVSHARAHSKKTLAKDEQRLARHILPALGSLEANAVGVADVAQLVERIGSTRPYEANQVRALLSVMFSKARMLGFEPPSFNPCEGVPKFSEAKRERFVLPEEMPRLKAAVESENDVRLRAAVWLYLLTGLRRNELMRLRWDDLDWERRTLRLEQTKAGRPHIEPLSEQAIAMLETIPRTDSPFVFPATRASKEGYFTGINSAWDRIRKRAGLEDVRLHDLRRTVGSWLAMSGESLLIIGKVLNHSRSSTTEIYARLTEHPARAALDKLGEMMAEAQEQKKANENERVG